MSLLLILSFVTCTFYVYIPSHCSFKSSGSAPLLSVVSILPSHVKRTATSQCLLVFRVEGHIKASLIRFHFQQMVSSININPIIAHGLLSKALQDHSPSRNIFNVARLHTIQTKRAARSASPSLGNCWRS